MPIFLSMGVCAMTDYVGGAHRDNDGGSNCDVLGSVVECRLHHDWTGERLMGMAAANPTVAQIDR
jgi:hypothetical protein